MKVRAILKSLLFAYALTGVALLLLALVLFAFDLGETAVDAGIIIIYVLACFMGGFMAGKIVCKDKYLWGVITGLAYYVLLLIAISNYRIKDMTLDGTADCVDGMN